MQEVVLGLVFLVFGLPNAIWSYKIARFQERMDSIGSRRSWSNVEPANWKVMLTKVFGTGMLVIGALYILIGLVG